MSRINQARLTLLAALLATAGSGLCAGVTLVDERDAQRGTESRNVRGGAEIVVSERRMRHSIPDRLKQALAEAGLSQLDGTTLKITRAEVALFIENATAIPGQLSSNDYVRSAAWRQFPGELVEVRTTSTLARRSYRVNIEGEIDGRAFAAKTEQTVPRIERRQDLERAVTVGVAEAVRLISGR